jgi:arylsulfatase A-like enzyme
MKPESRDNRKSPHSHTLRLVFGAITLTVVIIVAIILFPMWGGTHKPSVIVFMLDTLRADRLGCYGYAQPTSPHIDRLAARGVMFENAYAAADRTMFSLSQILTGRYFSRIVCDSYGVHALSAVKNDPPSTSDLFTLFRAAGYRVAYITVHPAFTKENSIIGSRVDDLVYIAPDGDFPHARFGECETVIKDWIDANAHTPFLLFIHLLDTHEPHDPPPPFDSFIPAVDAAHITENGQTYFASSLDETFRTDAFTEADREEISGRYDGGVAYTDHYFGRIMDHLQHKRLTDRAIVAIVSDHGQDLGETGTFGHYHIEGEHLSHVPLIIADPGGRLPAGKRSPAIAQTIDLAPTLVALAGIPVPDGLSFDGVNLAAIDLDDRFSARGAAVTMQAPRHDGAVQTVAVSDGRHRYIEGWDVTREPLMVDFYESASPPRLYAVSAQDQTVLPLDRDENRAIAERLRAAWGAVQPARREFAARGLHIDRPMRYFLFENIDAAESHKVIAATIDEAPFWTDDLWLVAQFSDIRTNSASEDVPPLRLSVQVPDAQYRVYLNVRHHDPTPTTLPFSAFLCRAESEAQFRRLATTPEGPDLQLLLLGEYRVSGGAFSIMVDNADEPVMALIRELVFIPVSMGEDVAIDHEVDEKLRNLGYLQ